MHYLHISCGECAFLASGCILVTKGSLHETSKVISNRSLIHILILQNFFKGIIPAACMPLPQNLENLQKYQARNAVHCFRILKFHDFIFFAVLSV